MVQTERPLHEPPFSYLAPHYGRGEGRLGQRIIDWWEAHGHVVLWEGAHHQRRATAGAQTMLRAWRRQEAERAAEAVTEPLPD